MPAGTQLHSESWYRIANQRVALRPHVRVLRQRFRGERWFVLHDPFSNQFYRLRPAAWEFIARLSLDRSVDAIWNEVAELDPLEAPGQEEALRLLAQLYHANLLHSTIAPDTAKLFERYRKRRFRETRAYLQNIMFARIPLIDPDTFLKWLVPLGRMIFGLPGLLVWLGVMGFAVKVVIDQADALVTQTQGVLAYHNLPWLYLGLVIIKLLHEFGHGVACRRYGGEVHTMGVMFLLFTPIPYMDATSSWSFRSRWHRAVVGAAGMWVELFVAALATFVWAATGPGVLNSLAFNMMFVASISTVLFNANPLLRFDGYYILSDLLDIPNLHQRAAQTVKHLVEYHVYGVRPSRSPARSKQEQGWLVTFSIASNIYRIFLFGMILLFLADRFLILGVIMTIVCIVTWIIVPLVKFVSYLAVSPRLDRVRPRAVGYTSGFVGVLVVLFGVMPWPHHFRAPGVIEARQHALIAPDIPGNVVEVLTPNGTRVVAGQPLFRLVNPEIALEVVEARALVEETRVRELRALRGQTADLAPLASRRAALEQRVATLEERLESLIVRAPHDGIWVAPRIADSPGAWVERGQAVGQVINDAGFRFTAVVSQTDASRLFEGQIRRGEIRLPGEAGRVIPVLDQTIIPADREELPAPALGWRAGGSVPVTNDPDSAGMRAAEPFFEVRVTMGETDASLVQGRSGWLRYTLPPEPLFTQLYRSLRQLLQKRYGL
jgi:putative peptide zinc metalloprotease protein